jgi:hypothetical protein
MYVVRFIRRGAPDELYFYPKQEDALGHANLFEGDDSGLYDRVEVENVETEKIVKVVEVAA